MCQTGACSHFRSDIPRLRAELGFDAFGNRTQYRSSLLHDEHETLRAQARNIVRVALDIQRPRPMQRFAGEHVAFFELLSAGDASWEKIASRIRRWGLRQLCVNTVSAKMLHQ